MGNAPKYVLVFLSRVVAQQPHLTFTLYSRQRIVDLVRRIVDEHLLGLIVAVDAVEHTHGVETADEPEYASRDEYKKQQCPAQSA